MTSITVFICKPRVLIPYEAENPKLVPLIIGKMSDQNCGFSLCQKAAPAKKKLKKKVENTKKKQVENTKKKKSWK